jgi:outer membrane protein OmpA-like peptidoglycan-associated protein
VIKILNKYPNLVLEISSHTDSKGDDASNMQLSEKRALAVVNYIISNSINIVSNGIDKKRVSGKGYGETKILNRCKNGIECNENEHKENRRTEFKFIKQ